MNPGRARTAAFASARRAGAGEIRGTLTRRTDRPPRRSALRLARWRRSGKGVIVGVAGEMEHGGACVHPMLGKPMRAAIGDGKAVIGLSVKVAAAGALLDVPLGHKDDSWSFPHFDTITVSVAECASTRRDPGRNGDR